MFSLMFHTLKFHSYDSFFRKQVLFKAIVAATTTSIFWLNSKMETLVLNLVKCWLLLIRAPLRCQDLKLHTVHRDLLPHLPWM